MTIPRESLCRYHPGEHRGWVISSGKTGTFNVPTPEGQTVEAEHAWCWHTGCNYEDSGWCWIPTDDLIAGQHVPGILEQMGVTEDE